MSDKGAKIGPTPEQYEQVLAVMKALMEGIASEIPGEQGARVKEIMDFRTSILSETDRGAVLMAAAFLDDKLKQLLEKRLVEDRKISRRAFEFNGSLGTFSSRIDFAYLIGVLPRNAQKDLHKIRAIRNRFAHHAAPLGYTDPKVKDFCEGLLFHGVKETAEPGSKFRRSVMGLLTHITIAIENVSHIDALPDYEVHDRSDAYATVATIFHKITGAEYPLKHEHE
ncbi:hypothetical protein [Xanthomonas hortorum]|uniref:MltR family transcriptional regulator n=1 Tax=Xanthomonas hortorum pv. hederae TaxID=453603 RepID=A0A9X4BWL0_9XANT|nr:hypothetical protein [Xanthomonas hortorum]MCE4373815.1 MltR family transcriptional regulator [Xanthomonas hortorum pv. hederae]MDC8640847.1 MltR family transcriptional regulator [Xanthomonas hortorum pv. hederae]PPU71115.1 hypothetical protein XhhCFBP4925_23000 [Xanthomonas hortorum pv. hederae]PUE91895.1 hypothetical protein C7T87_23895 [Xanthomonas hortorum pv. hederae]